MTKPHFVTFRIPDDLSAAMKALKTRTGIPYSELLRRALTDYLIAQGLLGPRHRP